MFTTTTTTTTTTRVQMPNGTWHQVDLAALSPVARAVAEALIASGLADIQVRSARPQRDLIPRISPAHAAAHGINLDECPAMPWRGWHTGYQTREMTAAQWLEYEAGKLTRCGWYPISRDGSDLPTSQAARTAMLAAA